MTNKKTKKIIVLDTNVPLHDPDCCKKFQEHDIIIPIHLLEQIDTFKKGSDTINANARKFTRFLDEVSSNDIFNGGVSLGEGLGKIQVALGVDYPEDFEKSFMEDTIDHRILCIAYDRQKKKENIVLVSKDINMRTKAKALGIHAEDYKNDNIQDMRILEQRAMECKYEEIEKLKNLKPNTFIYVSADKKENTVAYRWTGKLKEIQRYKYVNNIKARNLEQDFALDVLLDKTVSLVALTGIAGTGKTLISLAAALEQSKAYSSILVARPAIELSNKTLGFLPGGIEEKIDPYMMPLYDNIAVIMEAEQIIKKKGKKTSQQESNNGSNKLESVKRYMQEHAIEISALNYIRGRTFSNCFFIIDEAQNLTPHEVKTIITRAGEGTKVVLIGDIRQIDNPYLDERSSGLSYLIDNFSGKEIFAHVKLIEGERSALATIASELL